MNGLDRDHGFLRQTFEQAVRPLSGIERAERVLFSPGLGLGLGDQFMCRPLVSALCNRFPHARIDLLTDYPAFWQSRIPDRVFLISRAPGDSHGVLDVLGSRYDAALLGYHPGCLEELAALRNPTVFCAGTNLALFRAFHASDGACRELPLTLCQSALSEADRFVALFQDFGVIDPQETLWPSREHVRPQLPARVPANLSSVRILIHPGTGKPYKNWPLEKWGELAARLTRAGAAVAISSGATDEDARMAEAIARTATDAHLNPRLSLEAFLGTLDAYDLVLSSDTFLPHAVAAQGQSISLAVYGPTDPVRYCPPTARNFFITPLETGPEAFLDAIRGVLHLVSEDIEGLARRGCATELPRTAQRLLGVSRETSELLRELREGIREAYRTVLVGDEAQHLRMRAFLELHSMEQALQSPILAPVWRVARFLATATPKVSPIAQAGGDIEGTRRVESV